MLSGPASREEIGHFDGAVPVHYSVHQSLHQWEPVLNRIFSLNPPPPGIALKWAALDDGVARGDATNHFKGTLISRQSGATDFAVYSSSGVYRPVPSQLVDENVVRALCSPSFVLPGLTAPTGGNNFEDAAVWDPSDPREMLVVAIVENGDDLVMYRRLYHGN